MDDGSTDKSLELASKFISENELPWILISQKNSGQTKARNHGIQKASGEYIAFLDSDDLWSENKIYSQVAIFNQDSACIAVLSSFAIFSANQKALRVVRHTSSKKMNSRWLEMRGFGGGLESVGLVRRRTLDQIGCFDEDLSTASGLDLSLRLERFGKVVLLKEIGLYYRLAPGQWHTSAEPLLKDMEKLASKYGASRTRRIRGYQTAYFSWMGQEKRFSLKFVWRVSKTLLTFDFSKISMVSALIVRNLKAFSRGWLERKQTSAFLMQIGELD